MFQDYCFYTIQSKSLFFIYLLIRLLNAIEYYLKCVFYVSTGWLPAMKIFIYTNTNGFVFPVKNKSRHKNSLTC